jgi:hypothetical protein
MTELPGPAEAHHVIRTCLAIKGDSLESVLAIDSRNFASPEEFFRTRKEAFDEMERRRVHCEWETRPVLPGERPSALPSWAEYRVDLDSKHPLPKDEDDA